MNRKIYRKPKETNNLNDETLKKFGLDDNFLEFSESLQDLEKRTPNIVIVEALKSFKFIQNKYKEQELKKKNKYVMTLSIYNKLCYDHYNNKRLLKPANVTFKKLYKKYNGEDLSNKTLLIWRTGGFGDLLFIQPNLFHLKEKYPTCKIIFACGPQYKPMLNNWECIDELIDLPFDFKYMINSDYHIIFEGVIERCKEAEKVNCYKLFSKWLNLNLPEEKLKPVLNIKPDLVEECKNILLNEFGLDYEDKNLILCQYRASSIIRSLNPELFSKIINKLNEEGYKTIITDSPDQSNNIDNFINQYIDDKNKTFNFSKFSKSMDYTISMTSLMSCCLSTDSSLIHISQAVGTPVLGIYGPFPGNIRLETYDNSDWIDCNIKCGPCFLHGHKSCKNSDKDGYSKCFEVIDNDEILRKVKDLIKK